MTVITIAMQIAIRIRLRNQRVYKVVQLLRRAKRKHKKKNHSLLELKIIQKKKKIM